MGFVKGVMLGMIAGIAVGVVKSDCIIYMMRKGKKQVRRFKRRYDM